MMQPGLFDQPLPPHSGGETSRKAAKAARSSAATKRAIVFHCIRQSGDRGVTRQEIQDQTGLSGDTVRPRVYELLGRQGHPKLIRVDGRREYAGHRSSEVLKDIR